jgi:hypothetical protein
VFAAAQFGYRLAQITIPFDGIERQIEMSVENHP